METKVIKNLDTLLNEFFETLPRYTELKIDEKILLVLGFNDFSGMIIGSVFCDNVEMGSYEIYKDDVTKDNLYELMIKNLNNDILSFKEKVIKTSNAINLLTKDSEVELMWVRKSFK